MTTRISAAGISPELLAELAEAVSDARKGVRDPEPIKKASRDMDRMREQLRKQVGALDIAVDLIRDARSQ